MKREWFFHLSVTGVAFIVTGVAFIATGLAFV